MFGYGTRIRTCPTCIMVIATEAQCVDHAAFWAQPAGTGRFARRAVSNDLPIF